MNSQYIMHLSLKPVTRPAMPHPLDYVNSQVDAARYMGGLSKRDTGTARLAVHRAMAGLTRPFMTLRAPLLC